MIGRFDRSDGGEEALRWTETAGVGLYERGTSLQTEGKELKHSPWQTTVITEARVTSELCTSAQTPAVTQSRRCASTEVEATALHARPLQVQRGRQL